GLADDRGAAAGRPPSRPVRADYGSGCGRGRTRTFFFQAEDGIRDLTVTGVQTCALPILEHKVRPRRGEIEGLQVVLAVKAVADRSEERRVGKECRCRWWPHQLKKKRH